MFAQTTKIPAVPMSEIDVMSRLCRRSFKDFCRNMWDTVVPEKLIWNWHMDVLCDELQTLAERVFAGQPKEYDEVANICPGSSKSTIASIMFCPWTWTRMPTARTIGASYAHPLALDLSRRCRDVVKSEKYRACFPDVVLREDQDTKGYFLNTAGGTRYAVGVNGTVTGMHGHFIVIDDPIDPLKAISDAEMFTINHWIKETLSSRKVDKSVSVMFQIMQRLAQGDPTQVFLERKRVRHLRIPASDEYEINPPELAAFYTAVGEYPFRLMDPIRLSSSVLEEARSDLGEYGFAGQYGQDPVPAGGGMFKTDEIRWGPVPSVSEFVRIVRYWDKAATAEGARRARRASYTVGVKMGEDKQGRIWILDVRRRQLDAFARERLIKRTAMHDGSEVEVGVEVEGGSSGMESAQGTVRRLRKSRARVRLFKASSQGGKDVRADEFAVQVNAGLVYLPSHLRQDKAWTGWAKPYVDELRHFPFSKTKDQVDASSGSYGMLADPAVIVGPMPD